MQAYITKGCTTDHGGIIQQGDDSWIVDGKGVHLEGMTHFCPKCRVMSKAIATERGFMQVNGKNFIVAGDLSTCGSKYIKISDLAVRDRGTGNFKEYKNLSNKFLSNTQFQYGEKFILQDELTGEPLAKVCYEVHKNNGEVIHGTTDDAGFTEFITSDKEEEIELRIVLKERDHD